LNFIYRS